MNKYLYFVVKTSPQKQQEELFLDSSDKSFLKKHNVFYFPTENGKYCVDLNPLRELLAM